MRLVKQRILNKTLLGPFVLLNNGRSITKKLLWVLLSAFSVDAQPDVKFDKIDIVRDQWGVLHILHLLFFKSQLCVHYTWYWFRLI